MNITASTVAAAPAGPDALPAATPDMALAAAAAATPFAQWLAVGDLAAALPADPLDAGTTPDGEGAEARAEVPAADGATPAVHDGAMLAAMAMPLMPTVPVPAPAPAAAPIPAPATDPVAVAAAAPAPVPGAGERNQDAASAAPAAQLPQQPAAASAAAMQAAPAAVLAAQPGTGSAQRDQAQAPSPAPSRALAQALATAASAAPPAAPAVAAAAPATAVAASNNQAAGDAVAADKAEPAATGSSAGWGVGTASTATSSARPADTVALAGPPTAWRQTLHEALGERLQMQAGAKLEQAVIRLDPPNLGRVEIAIRHSAGSLEVTLTATHSEVVRQLSTVSENLRADLAQRQYSEVSVTVSQAPRAQQGGAGAFADQQGRGRQPGGQQEESAPGQALAEAGHPTSTFSLNGRE